MPHLGIHLDRHIRRRSYRAAGDFRRHAIRSGQVFCCSQSPPSGTASSFRLLANACGCLRPVWTRRTETPTGFSGKRSRTGSPSDQGMSMRRSSQRFLSRFARPASVSAMATLSARATSSSASSASGKWMRAEARNVASKALSSSEVIFILLEREEAARVPNDVHSRARRVSGFGLVANPVCVVAGRSLPAEVRGRLRSHHRTLDVRGGRNIRRYGSMLFSSSRQTRSYSSIRSRSGQLQKRSLSSCIDASA